MSKNTAVSKKVNESLKDMFNSWNACANKISGDKAIYELKDPTFPEYRKVCMFVDGHHMLIYGDYGSYVFDDMTWIANPGNLPYDNIGYKFAAKAHRLACGMKAAFLLFDNYIE